MGGWQPLARLPLHGTRLRRATGQPSTLDSRGETKESKVDSAGLSLGRSGTL